MFWLLLEQNQEVQNQIQSYKDKYAKAVNEETKESCKKMANISVDFMDKQLELSRAVNRRMYSSSTRHAETTSPQVAQGTRELKYNFANTEIKNLRASGGALNQRFEMSASRKQFLKVANDKQERTGTATREPLTASSQNDQPSSATPVRVGKTVGNRLAPLSSLQEARRVETMIIAKFKARDLNSTSKQIPERDLSSSISKPNSTQDVLNLISTTKTKNTLLEPLHFQSRAAREEIERQFKTDNDSVGTGLAN